MKYSVTITLSSDDLNLLENVLSDTRSDLVYMDCIQEGEVKVEISNLIEG